MRVENWGVVDYEIATKDQLALVEKVAAGFDDTLIFCSHRPVVTVGRGTKTGDVFAWQGSVVETSRGGRATYHGPSQMVIYPILNLTKARSIFGTRDVHGYLRFLEESTLAALHAIGIKAEVRKIKTDDGSPSLTGVWVNDRKIASIGIAVKKWITYHGIAVNFENDAKAFSGINPCGFQSQVMTSVEAELGRVDANLREKFASFLINKFEGLDAQAQSCIS